MHYTLQLIMPHMIYYLGLDARKPVIVIVVCKQQRCKLACYPHSMISTFIIRFLESKLATLSVPKLQDSS